MSSCQRGFTLVELITVMVILVVLGATALPRFFDRNTFDSRGLYDQTLSTLRHAQKTAIAQRRVVCVAFTASTITLTIDSDTPADGICNAAPAGNLTSPSGDTPYVVTAPANATLSGFVDFNFNALGQPSATPNIAISGYGIPVVIEAGTGYVH